MPSILKHSRRHDITFHQSGRIDISARIARRLSLAPGDVIDITRERGEYLIYVKLRAGTYPGRHTATVYATCHGSGTFRASSKAITSIMLGTNDNNGTLRCPCGDTITINNTTYISIINRCSL